MNRPTPTASRPHAAGFTLIELLVTFAVVALIFAIVVPNLGSFLPSARLDGSCSQLQRNLDWVRSEARIQGKRMAIELDLEKARWRIVFPPEQQLTREQEPDTLEERKDVWWDLEDGVLFLGAGDAKNGITARGLYRIDFDEYGFTGDQVVMMTLATDKKLVWSLLLNGLSGQVTREESTEGHEPIPQVVNEGAF